MSANIADRIARDLRARAARGDLPTRLTLAALAERYGTSVTPVRAAVAGLVADGVLTKEPSGRLTIGPRRPAEPPPEEPGADLDARLSTDLIRFSLAGGGHVREEVTATRLGVGRSALRSALGRLAARGLVEYLPRRGWRVRPFDDADLRAYLAVRVRLELLALDLARPRLVREDLEAMLHGNEPGRDGERLDNKLHAYLIEKAANPYIRDFFERHGTYHATLLDFAAPEADAVAAMATQHRDILRALIASDWTAARRALARHVRAQRGVMRRVLRRVMT